MTIPHTTRSIRKRTTRDVRTPSSSPMPMYEWPDESSDEDPTYEPSDSSDTSSDISLDVEVDDDDE